MPHGFIYARRPRARPPRSAFDAPWGAAVKWRRAGTQEVCRDLMAREHAQHLALLSDCHGSLARAGIRRKCRRHEAWSRSAPHENEHGATSPAWPTPLRSRRRGYAPTNPRLTSARQPHIATAPSLARFADLALIRTPSAWSVRMRSSLDKGMFRRWPGFTSG